MQKKQNDIALVWFRNDLRVQDNRVLNKAINSHKSFIACYCFDPRQFDIGKFGFKKTEKYRAKFLIETVEDLKENLKKLNIELFVFQGKPENHIKDLVGTYHIDSIYLQKEWTT